MLLLTVASILMYATGGYAGCGAAACLNGASCGVTEERDVSLGESLSDNDGFTFGVTVALPTPANTSYSNVEGTVAKLTLSILDALRGNESYHVNVTAPLLHRNALLAIDSDNCSLTVVAIDVAEATLAQWILDGSVSLDVTFPRNMTGLLCAPIQMTLAYNESLVSPAQCNCLPGTTGPLCETITDDCSTLYCGGLGSCDFSSNSSFCTCPAGFTGAHCATVIDCLSSPCQNGNECRASTFYSSDLTYVLL